MKILSYIANIVLAIILVYLSYHICYHSIKADQYQCQIYEELTIVNRLLNLLNFEKIEALKEVKQKQLDHYNQAKIKSWFFIGLSFVLITGCFLYMLHSQSKNRRLVLIRWLMFLSLLLLIIGILSPFLRIVVAKEIKLFGPFVFEYNTKSIATTIRHLSSTNVFLCLLILICSIIIPVFKVVLTYLSTHSSSNGVRTRSEFILKIIGKWAMTDVFVVAILLTFLSMDGKNSAQCDLDFGFYFFTAYCLLSFCCIFLIKNQPQLEMDNDDDWDFD